MFNKQSHGGARKQERSNLYICFVYLRTFGYLGQFAIGVISPPVVNVNLRKEVINSVNDTVSKFAVGINDTSRGP